VSDERLVMANTENGVPRPADSSPVQTLRTEGGLAMVIGNRAGGEHAARDAEAGPAQTVCTGESLAVVHMRGVAELQRNGDVRPADLDPVHTVRAGGQHHGLLVLRNNNSRGDSGAMLTPGHEPIRALTTSGHQSLVVPYHRTAEAIPASEPTSTLTTRDRLALIVPAGGGWADTPTTELEPVPTQTATESRAVVYTDDDIDACLFRMFALHEIAGAMAMGELVVLGNKRERMAQYGNAVTPPVMAWIIGRLLDIVELESATDKFCGAGGSSDGVRRAGVPLRLGLNHWQRAIESWATNFQDADHDCADISGLSTAQIRRYPDTDLLVASPECTNHSLAKGARRRKPQTASLFDDGPAGDDEQDRSRATMWDVVRFAEQKILKGRSYKAIVVENVVDAFKWGADDDGGLFNAWLIALDNLGYEHEIVWTNSAFHPPTPQSRDRMYVVFWLKALGRRPDLRFEPPAWCPHCEKLVEGRQTWKKPGGRVWGRYGAQYLYGCPDCHRIVLPGAFPAASIIDDSLPAPPIGERKKPLAQNTRERIRRGLERLAREPFAIRLTHGGQPRPLTLPLVTLTQRHDPAVVIPVAGNTYERTAGNRARRAAERPLDTVHGTLDRAIVVPPMGGVEPRPAATAPAPTQTTTTRASVVQPPEAA
jgi:DNA (cytosine-5)-methyltransferase 1